MMKQVFIITILTVAFLALGGLVYFRFICPTCQASGGNKLVEKNYTQPALITSASLQERNSVPQVGSLAPSFVLEDSAGQKVSLESFRNKKNVLLVFWATTCGWCEKERPDLNKFTKEQKDKIEVLAITWESKETLKKYLKGKQVDFTILSDPARKAQQEYLTFGTPGHFLIDKEGKIAAVRPGYANYSDLLMLSTMLKTNND